MWFLVLAFVNFESKFYNYKLSLIAKILIWLYHYWFQNLMHIQKVASTNPTQTTKNIFTKKTKAYLIMFNNWYFLIQFSDKNKKILMRSFTNTAYLCSFSTLLLLLYPQGCFGGCETRSVTVLPFYRTGNAADNFLSVSQSEMVTNAIAGLHMVYMGVVGYVYSSLPASNGMPIYRYLTNNIGHFFTTNSTVSADNAVFLG